MNKKIIPRVIEEPSIIALSPPNHTIKPIVIDVESSAIGKKIELYHTVFNQAFLCFLLIPTKLSYSIFCLLKS